MDSTVKPQENTPVQNAGNDLPKVTSPYKLAHVVLRTNKFDRMLEFYRVFLGARVAFCNGELGFLRYDDEHHRIAIVGLPNTTDKQPMSCGIWHVAFTFRTLGELLEAYSQRKAHGILPSWCVNHGPTTSMYYFDPDGNQIETQIDNHDAPEDSDKYMQSHSYEENPIGVEFDPEQLLEMLAQGANAEDIKRRIDIGPKDMRNIPQEILPTATPTVA